MLHALTDTVPEFVADPRRPLDLLAHCPVYEATPCESVTDADGRILLIKDESSRMGLGSFKALGGVYAVAKLIDDRWRDAHGRALTGEDFDSVEVRAFSKELTFVCASAGNHGLAVAAGARIFGARARIHIAESVPDSFADRLRSKSAEVVVSGAIYEDSVTAATADSESTESVLLADSSWEGYWRAPSLVMEGYTVLAEELRQHFESNSEWPTDVFLQAGVGGLASAIAYAIRKYWRHQPRIVVVEPDAAPCLSRSAAAGHAVTVAGPVSNMGRLDCKVPSLIAINVLRNSDVEYRAISDEAAATATEALSSLGFASTPSGAAGLAGLRADKSMSARHSGSRPLLIVTEGSA